MAVFNEIFFSFTFGGDMLGITAAMAVLDVLESEPVLEDVANIGEALLEGMAELRQNHGLEANVSLSGYPARHFLMFSGDGQDGLLLKSLFQQEAISRGILAAGWHAPSWAHTQNDVLRTLEIYDVCFAKLAKWLEGGDLERQLLGKMTQPVFRAP